MFWTGLIIGGFIGGAVGLFGAALFNISGGSDEDE